MRSRLACMGMGTLLAGCSALPSLVQGPKPAELNTPAAALATTSNSFDVPTIKKGGDAAAIAGLYAREWRDAARERLVERDVLNNTQFGLVVGGAVSAAKNSLTTAKWLLAGAGGTGLVSDRYQVEAQGIAYKQGAEAMECMRNEINLVPSSIWSQYGHDGELLEQAFADEDDSANETKEALDVLLRVIHDRLSQATNKLYENVSSKSLRVPKADDIAKAVSDQQQAAAKSADMANAFNEARVAGLAEQNKRWKVAAAAAEAASAPPPARPPASPVVPTPAAVKAALELPTKLATCVTKIP